LQKSDGAERDCFSLALKRWVTVGWTLGPRVSAAGNVEVGAFFAAHSDGHILAGLAASDKVGVFPFDPAMGDMLGAVDRPGNYLISTGGIIVVEKPNPGDDLIAVGKIECRSGAFDYDPVGIVGKIDQGL
jgi:hypothetical protein